MVACVRDNSCEELCFKTPQGGVCGCNEGYSLDTDGKSCIDINECENMMCSQLCENSPGSYICSCFDDYVLRSDGVSCKAVGKKFSWRILILVKGFTFYVYVIRKIITDDDHLGPPMEIFTAVDISIKRISWNLRSIEIINVLSNAEITGIDVNAINNFVYWSNGQSQQIFYTYVHIRMYLIYMYVKRNT